MKLMFLKAKYKINFSIPKNFITIIKKTFKKDSNLAIFCAIQFRDKLDYVKKLLEKEGFKTEISKSFRVAVEGQILGCDSYKDSLNLHLEKISGFVYIGDGHFHPNALLLAQEFEKNIKPVVIFNCVQKTVEVIKKEHIKKYLQKRKFCLAKFFFSENIGVFITTKWGQEYLETSLKLEKKYPKKKFYFFIGDNFLDAEIENFPFIECFVNTACPRIGQDDILRHKKAVVNLKDVL